MSTPASGFKIETVTRWNKQDKTVVSSPDYSLGFVVTNGGPLASLEAATAEAVGRLDRLLNQKYQLCARRLKPIVPDRPEQRRRLEKYLSKFGASQLLKSRVGRETWPKIARLVA